MNVRNDLLTVQTKQTDINQRVFFKLVVVSMYVVYIKHFLKNYKLCIYNIFIKNMCVLNWIPNDDTCNMTLIFWCVVRFIIFFNFRLVFSVKFMLLVLSSAIVFTTDVFMIYFKIRHSYYTNFICVNFVVLFRRTSVNSYNFNINSIQPPRITIKLFIYFFFFLQLSLIHNNLSHSCELLNLNFCPRSVAHSRCTV